SSFSRWSHRQRAERTASIRCVALRGGAPFFLLHLVSSPSALAGLRAALALQGNGLQPIPAARGLAPLTVAEQVAPARPSRLRRCALRWHGGGAICGRCHKRRPPSLITSSATVARARVPSRRTGPCPRLRLRAAPTRRLFP